jgi:hypothetical protein
MIEQLAKEYAGNHRKFDSFCWHDEPDDDENWTIVYTNNRDSGLTAQSNAKAIAEIMEPYLGDDVNEEHHGHWAWGWVDGYSIRVYRDGQITEAFKAWIDIQERLEYYPLLDDGDYSNREYEATIENLTNVSYDSYYYDPPDGWESEVFTWLWNNNQRAIENVDDHGGYATRDEIHEAMNSLGYRITYVVTWIDCGPMSEEYDDEEEAIERCEELRGLGFYPRLSE